MTPQEILSDINIVLQQITQESGTDSIKIGLVGQLSKLPPQKDKLYVWYINSTNTARDIFLKLHNDYGLEYDPSITGQYLCVYETEH
ncbi:MAG: hypothetical protein J0L69_12910 [Bacteroidetes bacterium]|nr:hypothetical protein [Bacteroidota bacterium]